MGFDDEKSTTDRLEKLFKKLVPVSGKADTIEGEMVRAIMRVWYRYYNDGDYFFRGYGKETVKPSVDWLKDHSPIGKNLRPIFAAAQRNALKQNHDDEYSDRDGYLRGIIDAAKAVCDYVEGRKGEYEKNELPDSR